MGSDPAILQALFSQFFPIGIDVSFEFAFYESLSYYGFSNQFDEVPHGQVTPTYRVEIIRMGEDSYRAEFKKVNNPSDLKVSKVEELAEVNEIRPLGLSDDFHSPIVEKMAADRARQIEAAMKDITTNQALKAITFDHPQLKRGEATKRLAHYEKVEFSYREPANVYTEFLQSTGVEVKIRGYPWGSRGIR